MRKLCSLALVPLAACTSIQPAPATPPGDACSPAALSRYTGQTANEALAARMKRETGKTALRWVQPGMAVTMDYREDRLTVYLDAANRVERASCS
ncbi:MAG: I78 family peptidase inhibitor [Hyphomicrobium sp.]|nr:I78 family peptidase inhibitor [Hyphomicrobium sp.]